MKHKGNIANLIILLLALMVMLVPMAQGYFRFYTEKKLEGDVVLANNIKLTTSNWFDGVYSQTKEKYLNDSLGFHDFFIRLNNQLQYSLFKKANAKGVVAGKDGFLYEIKYLQTHAGMDYVGDEEVKTRFTKLKFIQDTLAKKGIYFALLFAPGKATFYPEYIPAPYDVPSKQTNYLKYVEEAKRTGVNFYDFNDMFLKLKPASKYPLYPKTGTHWSIYGMYLAFDSLTRYMERLSHKELTRFDYSQIKLSDSLINPDGDIAVGMNLLYDLPHFTMAYPRIKWSNKMAFRPNVLTVSDSYWMGPYFLYLPANIFNKPQFWYYNKQGFNYNAAGNTFNTIDVDIRQSIEKSHFVFIMCSEAQLKEIGWGFIDEVYSIYKNGNEAYLVYAKNRKRNAGVDQIKLSIQNNPEWFNEIKKQAAEKGISTDSSLQLNAAYVYDEQHKNDPPEVVSVSMSGIDINQLIEDFKAKIKKDPKWLKEITKKAEEKNISVDSSVTLDAIWMAEHDERYIEQFKFNEKVQGIILAIKKDPKWLEAITRKAKEKNINLDSSIHLDAIWMAEQELKKNK